MTPAEQSILSTFRRFEVGPNEMLFLNSIVSNLTTHRIQVALQSLIQKGLVVKDRPKHAYYLTPAGYEACISS